jgi:spermidine synthase
MKSYLYFTVFAAGLTTLAVELSAARLLGNVFGTSNLVWASIIGLILIYLAAGYFIGGRWADRSPNTRTMYNILLAGAFLSGMVPLVSAPVLRMAASAFERLELAVLFGSFTAVLILFSIPITFLGMISPFAIRLSISDPGQAGTISGRIYAISTLGSFIGTFLPVLILIPLIGTTRTFLVFSGFLTLVALIGLYLSSGFRVVLPWLWMPLALIVLAVTFTGREIKSTEGQIFEAESSYNYIQVIEKDGYRYLRLNEGQGVHSIYHPDDLIHYGPWMQVLAAPFFNLAPHQPERVENMAIVGLAGGTTARQVTAVFGPIPIDGFEIDPQIIQVGKDLFSMTDPNLNAIPQDGRWGLERSQTRYSIISLDAYRPPYIPWHLTTQEFFKLVRDRLKDDGVMVMNVGRAPHDRRLIEGLVGTISTLFPSIYVMDIPDSYNSIIYATVQITDIENLLNNIVYLENEDYHHPLLIQSMYMAAAYLQPTPQSTLVFTDDLAPVEWITNRMVLNFIFSGDMEIFE